MRNAAAIALGVVLLGGVAASAPAGTVKIGEVELPDDCALARNEHPRLLFRGRDLPKYKERIAGIAKADFERFKEYWDKRLAAKDYDWKTCESMDGVSLGVLYQLTGQKGYADAVRRSTAFKSNSISWSHAFVLDLVIDVLSKEEIAAQAEIFLKDVDGRYRYGSASYCLWPAIALYGAGSGRDEELARLLARGISQARGGEKNIAYLNKWAANRGGDVNSFSYVGNHTLIWIAAHLCAFTNALGEDLWSACPWARHIGSYYIYHFMPWTYAAIHFDNTTALCIGPDHGDFGGTDLLAAAPARYRDGLYQWWLQRMLYDQDPLLTGWPKEARAANVMGALWGRILFHDESVPELGPENFPPSRFFLTRGMASMRENWSQDATFVHFRCGAWGDLGDARHNADNNTFTIYRKGILALDTGAAHALDCSRLKFDPPSDGPNTGYSSHTLAHNGVLVAHESAQPQGLSGGQVLRNWPSEWAKIRGNDRGAMAAGKVLAWETSPEYDYVCGDATNGYNPAAVSSFTRQLVYVRPSLVFVFDRVETARDGCKTVFLLHTADRPRIDGKETPDTRIHPEGHFLWEGAMATVTDEEMGGRMFARTLLPDKREVRLLGGAGHDFELPSGKNLGPTEQTYAMKADDPAVRQSRRLGEGLRGWRIETEDRTGSRSVRFLHVFQTVDKSVEKMAACELVRREGMVGAKVEVPGRTVEVFFADSGAVGGAITITQGEKQTVKRPLAGAIEDNYTRWKDHTDYAKWTTDPFRRSVVLGDGLGQVTPSGGP